MIRSLLLAAATLLSATPVLAHPHVFIDAQTEILFEGNRIVAVRHAWRFDEAFSAWASQGLDKDNDGQLSVEELAPLAKINVDSLQEFDYFTSLRLAGKVHGFKLPEDYFLKATGNQLTLYYALPVKDVLIPAGKEVAVEVFDPTYFVDFKLVEDVPARLVNAPENCKLTVSRPRPLDPNVASVLGQVPATQRNLPPELLDVTKNLANRLTVTCP